MCNIFIKVLLLCAFVCYLRPGHFVSANQLPNEEIDPGGHQPSDSQTVDKGLHSQEVKDSSGGSSSSIETQLTPPPIEKLGELDVNHGTNPDNKVVPVDSVESSSSSLVDINNSVVKDVSAGVVDSNVNSATLQPTPNDETRMEGDREKGPDMEKVSVDEAASSSIGDPALNVQAQQQPQLQQPGTLDSSGGAGSGGDDALKSDSMPDVAASSDVANATTASVAAEGLTPPLSPPVETDPATTPASETGGMEGAITGDGTDAGLAQRKEENDDVHSLPVNSPVQVDSSSSDPVLETVATTTTDLPRGMGGMALNAPIKLVKDGAAVGLDSGLDSSKAVDNSPGSNQGQGGGEPGIVRTNDKKSDGAEEDFPTFDKWSVQYLAEQEKQKIEKEMEQAVDPAAGQKLKKLRLNFASKVCGAKVMASNPEADNTDKLLNSNPDEYMISPCKAKKWFVVELCEPLQVHRVELGTVELFSSQPKSFQLFASQRYPAKEWTPLGTFEMTTKRSIQAFQTAVTDEYVKYIRVEMLEHHGEEHYCPITAFRVLGLDMASDDDEETDGEVIYTHEQGESGEEVEDEESLTSSLFEQTKDTVVKLVQKVLYPVDDSGQEDKAEAKQQDIPVPEDHKDNTTTELPANVAANVVGEGPASQSEPSEEDKGPTAHYPVAGRVDEAKVDVPAPQQPDTEKEDIPKAPVKKEPEEIPIITKLRETEQLPTEETEIPVVVKLDSEEGDQAAKSERSSLIGCCHLKGSPWLFNDRLSYYGFAIHPLYFCTLDGMESLTMLDRTVSDLSTPSSVDSNSQQTGWAGGPDDPVDLKAAGDDSVVVETTMTDIVKQRTREVAPSLQSPSSDREDVSIVEEKKDTSADMNNQGDVAHPPDLQDKQASSSQTTQFSSADVSTPTTQVLEPSSLSPDAGSDPKVASVVTPLLNIEHSKVKVNEMGSTNVAETIFLKVSPSPTSSSLEVADNTVLTETATSSKLSQEKPPTTDTPATSPGSGEGNQPVPQAQGIKGSSAEGNGTTKSTSPSPSSTKRNGSVRGGKQADLVKVPLSASSKRDASIMKLNNRIVALEQNVSMAKRYLEELSKAFKQQNEDMMTLVNKTIVRFNAHVTWTEERDLHQKTEIEVLEQRLSNLTWVVLTMQGKMDIMGQDVHNKQLILSVVQVLLFLWMTISSIRGRRKSSKDTISDHKFLLDTMPSQPQVDNETMDGGRSLVRRNSDVGMAVASLTVDGTPLKRQSSDTDIVMSSSPVSVPMIPHSQDVGGLVRGASQASKKRKKRKLKGLQPKYPEIPGIAEAFSTATSSSFLSSSTSTMPPITTSSSLKSPTQTPSFSSHAGVLFGVHAKKWPDGTGDKSKSPWPSLHVSPFSSTKALKENLPLLSLGVIPGVEIDPNSPSKGVVTPSSISSPEYLDKSLSLTASDLSFSRDKSLTPPLVSVENVLRSEQRSPHFHPSRSPEKENGSSRTPHSVSPEFKLPSYHRSKLRKLGKSLDSNLEDLSVVKKGKGIQKRGAMLLTSRKTTSPPSPPKSAMDNFFDEETLLSENRFQLPFSPSKLDYRNYNNSSVDSDNLLSRNFAVAPAVHRQNLVNGTHHVMKDSSLRISNPAQLLNTCLSTLPSLPSSSSSSSSSSRLSSQPLPSYHHPANLIQSPPPPPPPPPSQLQRPLSFTLPSPPLFPPHLQNRANQSMMPSFFPLNQSPTFISSFNASTQSNLPSSIIPTYAPYPVPFHGSSSPRTSYPSSSLLSSHDYVVTSTSTSSTTSKKDKDHLPPSSSYYQQTTSSQPALPISHEKSDTKDNMSKKGHNSHRRQGSFPTESQTAATGKASRGSSESKVISGKAASTSASGMSSSANQVTSCLPKIKKSGSCSAALWSRTKGGKQSHSMENTRADSVSPPASMGKRNSTYN